MTFTITLTLGQRLRYARQAAGLEQEDLEKHVLTGRAGISAWENDKARPHAFKLQAFARACNVPVEFFDGDVRTFSMVPDGGSPLAGTSSATTDTGGVTRGYRPSPHAGHLALAA